MGIRQRDGEGLFVFVQHPVTDTQLVDHITVLAGAAAQLFTDICHVYLELFDAALIHASPDGTDNGGIGHDLAHILTQKGQNIIWHIVK